MLSSDVNECKPLARPRLGVALRQAPRDDDLLSLAAVGRVFLHARSRQDSLHALVLRVLTAGSTVQPFEHSLTVQHSQSVAP
jgi:hypothetical protein